MNPWSGKREMKQTPAGNPDCVVWNSLASNDRNTENGPNEARAYVRMYCPPVAQEPSCLPAQGSAIPKVWPLTSWSSKAVAEV